MTRLQGVPPRSNTVTIVPDCWYVFVQGCQFFVFIMVNRMTGHSTRAAAELPWTHQRRSLPSVWRVSKVFVLFDPVSKSKMQVGLPTRLVRSMSGDQPNFIHHPLCN